MGISNPVEIAIEKLSHLFGNVDGSGKIKISQINQVIKNLPIEFAIFDINGNYQFINELYITDAQLRKDVLGKNDSYLFQKLGISVLCAEDRKKHFKIAVEEKKRVRFTEKLIMPVSGKTKYYKRILQPILKNDKIYGVCLFGNDLTALIHGQKELKYLAFHDKITELENREAFYKQLDQIFIDLPRSTEKTITAVLFCDLDGFKLVNDTLGHDIGDEVLREVAQRIQNSLRKSDQVFRIGGDEFTIINKHLNSEYDAAKIAGKILKSLSEPYFIKGHKITYLTVSIGIGTLPKDGTDRETIIKNADLAMYTAKKEGKNQVQFFSKEMTDKSIYRLKIENNLQRLVHDYKFDQECRVLYQPILEWASPQNYKIIGSEALIRWNNPELGHVPPAVFIPVAEETNLISSIGEWVLHKTCKDIKQYIHLPNGSFFTSINLSAKQLQSTKILSKIKSAVDYYSINPANFQLEITETSYLEDQSQIYTILNELKDMGFKIAIDDFGSGFGSLVYLQKIPATAIKIDKSFVIHLSDNKDDKQLVKSIISLGSSLNKEIIAEGVETREHLNFLSTNQCKKYQGFLFSRPVDINTLKSLIDKNYQYN